MPANPLLSPYIVGRNLGGTESSTVGELQSVTITGVPTGTPAPFFQQPSDIDGNTTGSDITKTALEWVFAIAALLVVGGLGCLRYARMRRMRHTFTRDFSPNGRRRHPRTTGLSVDNGNSPYISNGTPAPLPMSAALFYPPAMTRIPRASLISNLSSSNHPSGRGRRAAQGADIDSGGRRGGARDTDDRDMYGGFGGEDKDILPAYENVGGPPKYGLFDGHAGGGGDAMPISALPALLHHEDSDTRRASSSSDVIEPTSPAHDGLVQFPQAEHVTANDLDPVPSSRPPPGGGEPPVPRYSGR